MLKQLDADNLRLVLLSCAIWAYVGSGIRTGYQEFVKRLLRDVQIPRSVCCYADKRTSAAAATAGTQAPSKAAAAAVGGAVKAKAKKVPRYVKEALEEVEQEKLTKLAVEQTQASAQTNLQKAAKVGKASKAKKKDALKVEQSAKQGKLADPERVARANR